MRHTTLRGSDVVCDLGCGDGRLLFELSAVSGCRGVGVDINMPLIEQAKVEATALGGDRISFIGLLLLCQSSRISLTYAEMSLK